MNVKHSKSWSIHEIVKTKNEEGNNIICVWFVRFFSSENIFIYDHTAWINNVLEKGDSQIECDHLIYCERMKKKKK